MKEAHEENRGRKKNEDHILREIHWKDKVRNSLRLICRMVNLPKLVGQSGRSTSARHVVDLPACRSQASSSFAGVVVSQSLWQENRCVSMGLGKDERFLLARLATWECDVKAKQPMINCSVFGH